MTYQPTPAEVAAAKLQIKVEEKLGRPVDDRLRQLAAMTPRPISPDLTVVDSVDLRHLAEVADRFALRNHCPIVDTNEYRFAHSHGVRDVLRWLAGDEPTEWLREALQP